LSFFLSFLLFLATRLTCLPTPLVNETLTN
jgi:hypothetical protein